MFVSLYISEFCADRLCTRPVQYTWSVHLCTHVHCTHDLYTGAVCVPTWTELIKDDPCCCLAWTRITENRDTLYIYSMNCLRDLKGTTTVNFEISRGEFLWYANILAFSVFFVIHFWREIGSFGFWWNEFIWPFENSCMAKAMQSWSSWTTRALSKRRSSLWSTYHFTVCLDKAKKKKVEKNSKEKSLASFVMINWATCRAE